MAFAAYTPDDVRTRPRAVTYATSAAELASDGCAAGVVAATVTSADAPSATKTKCTAAERRSQRENAR